MAKSLSMRAIYGLRDLRSREMFDVMRDISTGHVLDVGGWDFFLSARRRGIPFERWTCLESDPERHLQVDDPRFALVTGDGCAMGFEADTFDTVLCVQVLEHVFEPFAMLSEIVRVLRPGGRALVIAPWTTNLHLAPHHYQNFTRYWFKEACRRLPVEVERLDAMGGYWSSVASRHFLYFLQLGRYPGMHVPEEKRSPATWLLAPFGVAHAAVGMTSALMLSAGDLREEANNHLLVLRKV